MFNFKQLFAYETIKIFGIADRICDQTGGNGNTCPGGLSQDGHQRGDVLQLEEEIRWPGGLRAAKAQEP